MDRIIAPWDYETVAKLNGFQQRSHMHPFTCGIESGHGALLALTSGWVCPEGSCKYTQDWAHRFMAEG